MSLNIWVLLLLNKILTQSSVKLPVILFVLMRQCQFQVMIQTPVQSSYNTTIQCNITSEGAWQIWWIWSNSPKFYPSKFTYIYHKLWAASTTNEYWANIREHAWLKLVTTIIDCIDSGVYTIYAMYHRSLTSSIRLMAYVTTKSTWTLFNHRYSLCQYLLDYLVLFHKELMLCYWEHSKLHILIFVSSWVLSPHHTLHCKCVHRFSVARDDKINNCGFKFSAACEWCV